MSIYQGSLLIAGRTPVPTGAMTYKGTCLQKDLPIGEKTKGDYYKLSDESGIYVGQCAIWSGESWDYSTANVTIDSVISAKSKNPVTSETIYNALDNKVDKVAGKDLFSGEYEDLLNKPKLFSGNYNDLTNKPILFSGNYNDLDHKPDLKTVALTGKYNDLEDKPDLSFLPLSGGKMNGEILFKNGKAITDYLPLAGGKMTGSIIIKSGDNGIVNSINTEYTEICGGINSNKNGAYLTLRGKGSSWGAGYFRLAADSGSGPAVLEGRPNKKIYWDGRTLVPIGTCALSGTRTDINGNAQNFNMPAGATPIAFVGHCDGQGNIPYFFMCGGAYIHFSDISGRGPYGGGGDYSCGGTVYYVYPGYND